MANYCPSCGTKVEESWKVCPNCGEQLAFKTVSSNVYQPGEPRPDYAPPPQPSPYGPQPTQAYKPRRGNKWGTYSLICGIIGCCFAGIILGPIAIILAAKGLKEDDNTTYSIIGLIIGVLDIVGSIISMFMLPDIMDLYY